MSNIMFETGLTDALEAASPVPYTRSAASSQALADRKTRFIIACGAFPSAARLLQRLDLVELAAEAVAHGKKLSMREVDQAIAHLSTRERIDIKGNQLRSLGLLLDHDR